MAILNKDVYAVVVLAMTVVALAPHAGAALRCDQVTSFLSPCVRYLKNGGSVEPSCCRSVRSLAAAAKTTVDRRKVCRCLEGAYRGTRGIQVPNAQSLPGRCGVKVPPKIINPTTDCSRVR